MKKIMFFISIFFVCACQNKVGSLHPKKQENTPFDKPFVVLDFYYLNRDVILQKTSCSLEGKFIATEISIKETAENTFYCALPQDTCKHLPNLVYPSIIDALVYDSLDNIIKINSGSVRYDSINQLLPIGYQSAFRAFLYKKHDSLSYSLQKAIGKRR